MPRERERRGSNQRIFTVTGLPHSDRSTIGKQIQKLGAVLEKSSQFQSNVTHVICGKLSRSEKFLGALALGRWVVRPDYITASLAARRWLDEVEYEWSSLQEDHCRLLAAAAKRNRWRASTTTEKIFAGWQVAVVMRDTKRQNVYKRLLACGGAKIWDIKLTTKNPARDSEHLTYLFVDEATAPLTQSLQDHGVMCLNSDFISDYIVLYPPPEPLDYLLPADASHCPGQPAPGEVLDDNSVAMGSTEQNGAGNRSSAVAAQQSAAVYDGDDDMLVISQCPSSSPQERLFRSINEVDESTLVASQCRPSPSQKSCTRSIADVGDSVLETPEHPASRVTAADVDVNTDDDDVIFVSESIAPKGSKAMVAGGSGNPQHGIPRPSQTPVGMTGIRDCHHPGLSQSGASASNDAGTLWLSMSADENRLVLTDCGAGREEGKEPSSLPCSAQQGNCQEQLLLPASAFRQDGTDPVILASASSTITTAASSSDLSASSPIAAASTASPTRSCLKKEQGGGDHQFTVADVKKETKMLKKEVTMGPAKQSLVSTALKKGQKSLREWFSPTGKENAEQEGLSKEVRVKGQLRASGWSRAHRENEKTLGARPSQSESAVNANRSKMSQSERASSQIVCKPSPSKCVLNVGLSKPSASESVTDLTQPEPSSAKRASSSGVSKPSSSVNALGSDRLKPSSSTSKNTSNLDLFKPSTPESGKHLNWPKLSPSECASSDSRLSKPSASERVRGLNWLEPSASKGTSDFDLSEPSAAESGKHVSWPKFSPSKSASDLSLSKPPSIPEIVRGPKVKASASKCTPNIDLSKPSTSEGGRHLNGPASPPSQCASHFPVPKPSASESVRSLSAAGGTASVNLPLPSAPSCATKLSPTKPCSSNSKASVVGEETHTLDLGHETGQEEMGPVSTSSDALTSLSARSKQSEVLSRVLSSTCCVPGVQVNRTGLTAAAQTVGAGKAQLQPASSEGVFSAQSLNKSRSSRRTKITTARMSSFRYGLRKRKKPDDSETDHAEQPAAEAPPAELTRVPQVKRQKTARGISQKMAMGQGQCAGTSGSVSGLEQKPEAAQTGVTRVQPSSPTVHSGATDPLGKTHRLGSPFKKQSYTADLSSEPPHSSVTCRLPSTRWRLSSVPLPGQIDLSNCNAPRLEQLGSRTFPESLSAMVSSCLEDGYFQAAVAMAMTVTTLCPSVEVLKHMVTVVKDAGNPIVVNQAYTLLMTWLDQFPPITPNLRDIYEKALAISKWETFKKILKDAVRESGNEAEAADAASPAPDRARLVLRFVVAALEKNFLHFAHSTSSQGRYNCLIIRCLWSPAYQVYPNRRSKDLLHFLETALMHHSTPQACWQELLNLVAMAAQCCHLADNSWEWRVDGHVERCSGTMVHELARTITGGGVDTVTRLQQVLACLSPPWLLRQVSAALLSDYDDYLVPGGLTSDPITLREIVSKYFFLLPTLSAQNKSENASPRKKLKMAAVTKDENKAPAVDPKLTAKKVNKRNPKGETLLHKAAIKNDISYLKQLLDVPGVDVNAQDYAGWTPLHEACNRGHTECVKALLKFAPNTATLDSFFQSGRGSKAQRVDLHLANVDGITALHDAVTNNHMGTVKLLLKYGGSSLLKAKTVLGYTPLDLATTEEMCMVLSRDSLDISLSQESFSQDPDIPERESVPSSFMYREVLDNSDGSSTQLTASLEEARKFLALLTFLLRSHCQVRKQQQQQQQQRQQQQRQQQQRQRQQQGAEGTEAGHLELHAQYLRRHMRKITTDEVFSHLTVQLAVIEALLTQCC